MVPGGREISEKQLFNLIDKVENIAVNPDVAPYLDSIYKKLQWLEREQLIQHFVSVEFNQFLEYYKDAADLNVKQESRQREPREFRDSRDSRDRDRSQGSQERRPSRERGESGREGFSKLKINVGNANGLKPTKLIGIINDRTRNRDIAFGKIDVTDNATYFEVSAQHVKEVAFALMGSSIQGVDVDVEYMKGSPRGGQKGERRSGEKQDRGQERYSERKSDRRSDKKPDKGYTKKKRPF
jgi:ATP-dependent RNA helicase DeaD